MLAITKLGSIVEIREFGRDDRGHVISVWGVLLGTTHHGVWPIDDIATICNR
jgi:hypothetical protein